MLKAEECSPIVETAIIASCNACEIEKLQDVLNMAGMFITKAARLVEKYSTNEIAMVLLIDSTRHIMENPMPKEEEQKEDGNEIH